MQRRTFLGKILKILPLVTLSSVTAALFSKAKGREHIWYIDPKKCTGCGNCATKCVLSKSAVVCVINHKKCSYDVDCPAYFISTKKGYTDSPEYHVCPTGAITRTRIEEKLFEYSIDKNLCIGCGKCSVRCVSTGFGAMNLVIDYQRCTNCNECAIALTCTSQAIYKIKANAFSPIG